MNEIYETQRQQSYLPSDYDGVVDRRNDIIFHDRTQFDENVAVLMSDLIRLAKSLIKLAEDNGVSEEALGKIVKLMKSLTLKRTLQSFRVIVQTKTIST